MGVLTSVFGGQFDSEFAAFTVPLFQRLEEEEFTLLYSDLVQEELSPAPLYVKNFAEGHMDNGAEFLIVNEEAALFATEYIAEGVVGPTSYQDCLHIALATINKADYLVSWNFKHVVNVFRIRGYNAINLKNGYKPLEIRSPRDFMRYETDN